MSFFWTFWNLTKFSVHWCNFHVPLNRIKEYISVVDPENVRGRWLLSKMSQKCSVFFFLYKDIKPSDLDGCSYGELMWCKIQVFMFRENSITWDRFLYLEKVLFYQKNIFMYRENFILKYLNINRNFYIFTAIFLLYLKNIILYLKKIISKETFLYSEKVFMLTENEYISRNVFHIQRKRLY